MARFNDYISALRAFAYPASVLPSLTGSVAALMFHHSNPAFHFSWLHSLLTVLGCIAIHSVSNLVNDYFDFRSGLDSAQNFGLKNPLVRGSLTLADMRRMIATTFAIAIAVALYFVLCCGLPILYLVLFGAFSAWFYTAPPFKLKYRGGGDLQVILSFGILITVGSYYTQVYSIEPFFGERIWLLVALSLPQSLLINAILHANNHRDRESDVRHGARTLATRLSEQNSERYQYLLLSMAYSLALLLSYFLSPFLLLTLLSLPQAWRVAKNIQRKEQPGTAAFKLLVADAAKLQFSFGLLMLAGILISIFSER